MGLAQAMDMSVVWIINIVVSRVIFVMIFELYLLVLISFDHPISKGEWRRQMIQLDRIKYKAKVYSWTAGAINKFIR